MDKNCLNCRYGDELIPGDIVCHSCNDYGLNLSRWEESEASKLEHINKRLCQALRNLYDEQNGPPLLRWQDRWEKAMAEAAEMLRECDKGCN